MPRPRQYQNRAEQQAAYRQRRVKAHLEQLTAQRLPALPALPTMPGHQRWKALLELAQWATQTIIDERQDYFDDRSQTWQESDRGDDFNSLTEEIQELMDSIDSLSLT